MRRAVLAALLAAAVVPAPAAAAAPAAVSMPGKYFEPARLTVVSGDAVTFRNSDLVTHNVTLAGGQFASGPLGRSASWTHAAEVPGEYPFVCTLHAFMSGNLSVLAATLEATPDDVLAGQPLSLSGRTRAGTTQLGLERAATDGAWIPLPEVIAPDPDGTFSIDTPAVAGASYRVTTPAGPSRAVTPKVTASIDVHVALRRARLSVHAMPAPAGLVATLQLYDRWRYRWRARRTVRLDRHGGAAFRVPRGARTYARVVLRRPSGPALVASRVVRTSDGRTAADPDTLAPPGAGGGHGGH